MTNKEKFVQVFGKSAYDAMSKDADRDILLWFLEDYRMPSAITNNAQPHNYVGVPKAQITRPNAEKLIKKRIYTGNKEVEKYIDAVEDFFLSGEKTKDFFLKDDATAKVINTLYYRLTKVISILGLEEEVKAHRYYIGTANEAVVLENVAVPKNPVTTYKCL